jgi:hypothetical protein
MAGLCRFSDVLLGLLKVRCGSMAVHPRYRAEIGSGRWKRSPGAVGRQKRIRIRPPFLSRQRALYGSAFTATIDPVRSTMTVVHKGREKVATWQLTGDYFETPTATWSVPALRRQWHR